MDFENNNPFEKNIIDLEDIGGTEIKINPDYYIHWGIIKAQSALSNPNVNEAFIQYRMFVEHIEVIARAAKYLSEEYENKLKEFLDSEEYKKLEKNIQQAQLANKKLGLILFEVFSQRISFKPLKH